MEVEGDFSFGSDVASTGTPAGASLAGPVVVSGVGADGDEALDTLKCGTVISVVVVVVIAPPPTTTLPFPVPLVMPNGRRHGCGEAPACEAFPPRTDPPGTEEARGKGGINAWAVARS